MGGIMLGLLCTLCEGVLVCCLCACVHACVCGSGKGGYSQGLIFCLKGVKTKEQRTMEVGKGNVEAGASALDS